MKHQIKTIIVVFPILLLALSSCNKSIEILEIRCNNRCNPTGVKKTPYFNWQLASHVHNQLQTSYHILVSDNENELKNDHGKVWDCKKTASESSINIKYIGLPLEPGKAYYWKVKVWDKDRKESKWSETGLEYG